MFEAWSSKLAFRGRGAGSVPAINPGDVSSSSEDETADELLAVSGKKQNIVRVEVGLTEELQRSFISDGDADGDSHEDGSEDNSDGEGDRNGYNSDSDEIDEDDSGDSDDDGTSQTSNALTAGQDPDSDERYEESLSVPRRRQRRTSINIKPMNISDHDVSLDSRDRSDEEDGMGGKSRIKLRGTYKLARRTTVRTVRTSRGSFGEASSGSGSGSTIGSDSSRYSRGKSNKRVTIKSVFSKKYLENGLSVNSALTETRDQYSALSNLDGAGNTSESVFAAAALVASSASGGGRAHQLYSIGDRVLVNLSFLKNTLGSGIARSDILTKEVQKEVDEQIEKLMDNCTLIPVNKYGYGLGKAPPGSRLEEREPPFCFVLATVQRVHFEEDARYYTVRREDTGECQRADADFMEGPLSFGAGYEAALVASKTTKASMARAGKDDPQGILNEEGFSVRCKRWYYELAMALKTWYRSVRQRLKWLATDLLFGNSPYGCRISLTGVNLSVLCSFLFMFIDCIRLAFLPVSVERGVMIVAAVIWIILVLELLFETLIRPPDYRALLFSEKAYAPSTARYIRNFHLFFEFVALAFFAPEFRCFSPSFRYGEAFPFSLLSASLKVMLSPGQTEKLWGNLFFFVQRLRIFALVRHWKKMWINHMFVESTRKTSFLRGFLLPKGALTKEDEQLYYMNNQPNGNKKNEKIDTDTHLGEGGDDNSDSMTDESKSGQVYRTQADKKLRKAATIDTALMSANSHRVLLLAVGIFGMMPLIYSLQTHGGSNLEALHSISTLQENNMKLANASDSTCHFFENSVKSFISANLEKRVVMNFGLEKTNVYLLWARVLPVRCDWQGEDGVVTVCSDGLPQEVCNVWSEANANSTPSSFAEKLDLRVGTIVTHSNASHFDSDSLSQKEDMFNVTAMFNEEHSVTSINFISFLLQWALLLLVLVGLTILRWDASRLVIDPIRRMLKIVLRYASNPLASTPSTNTNKDGEVSEEKDQLGNYETEQLINAISKITDLLRKCWGVAGAGIISANLARTQEGNTVTFNPTVPGKRVYALFAFAGIKEFAMLLRNLDQAVMVLINDVATVVHEEVFRWGFGGTGQCNKNLGAAFLMVYRIGDFEEVQKKKAMATDVIFSEKSSRKKANRSQRHKRSRSRSNADDTSLQLASLPGIHGFTDRALLGMLKSFAGIHRDKSLLKWRDDLRLGAGVGAFAVNMIFGMDAGWAVEGAVGSEFKIDATYLSPHVNMASRMMSASKQYGVTILLSQAVEELLSSSARKKLRHLDTVTVKGSSIPQRIYTYDARHRGIEFFLFERDPAEADLDAESYNSSIWNKDPDLKAMRQHISEEFEDVFKQGIKKYLAGNWAEAIKGLKEANQIMITHCVEEGHVEEYLDEDTTVLTRKLLNPSPHEHEEITHMRSELIDGTCINLISYMEKEGGVAPKHWKKFRPLTSK